MPYTGCVNWQAYDTNAIWQMLKDEDAAAGYAGVVSWQSLESHLQVSEERLRAAREALAAAWPPEQNESGQAFLQQLDWTLASIGDTRTAAASIKSGLNGLVGGLAELRGEVREQVAHRMDASDDITPRWWNHAEDEIDAQVRQTMAAKERTFVDYASQIHAPEPYKPHFVEGGGPDRLPPDGGGSPPPTGGGVRLAGHTPVPVPVPHDPPAPRPGHDPFAPPGAAGPVTGGVPGDGTVLQGSRPSSGRPAGAGAGPGRPGPDGGSDGFVPGLTVGLITTTALTPLFDGPGAGPLSRGPVGPVSMRSGLPSGSVIGEGGIGRPATGSPTSAGTAAGRAGVPGVIGGQPGAAGRGNTMMPGLSGRGRPGEQSEDLQRDPDNAWGADEGVAPVINPDTSSVVHDPGTGVIGWDR